MPVVLCSGDLEHASERGLAPGMVQTILQKPFSTQELIQAIARARGGGGEGANAGGYAQVGPG